MRGEWPIAAAHPSTIALQRQATKTVYFSSEQRCLDQPAYS